MSDVDVLLRRGLRSIPDPPISLDFDAVVLNALKRPVPWWTTALRGLAPTVSAGGCGFLVTIAVISAATRLPVDSVHSPPTHARASTTAQVNVDELLDGERLCLASIASAPRHDVEKIADPDHDAKPDEEIPRKPGRRSSESTNAPFA